MKGHSLCAICLLLLLSADTSLADVPIDLGQDRPRVGPVTILGAVPWQLAPDTRQKDFAPDGSFMAYAGKRANSLSDTLGYRVITILDGKTGYAMRRLQSPGEDISALRVSPSGKRIAVCKSSACIIAMMDADSGDTLWQFGLVEDVNRGSFSGVSKPPNASPGVFLRSTSLELQFSHDSKLLFVTTTTRTVWVLDTETGSVVRRLHAPRSMMLRLLPDGKTMVTARDDETLGIWEVVSGVEKKRVVLDLPAFDPESDKDQLNYLRFKAFWPSPDGRIALLETVRGLGAVDLASGKLIKMLKRFGTRRSEVFSPDGKYLVHAAPYGPEVWVIDTRDMQTLYELNIDIHSYLLPTFSPDGKRLGMVIGSQLRWWNIESGKQIPAESAHLRKVRAVALSPDGSMAATMASHCSVRLWSTSTGAQLHSWPYSMLLGYTASCLSFSPDGKLLAANFGKSTAIIRCQDGQVLHEFPASDLQKKISRSTWRCTLRFSQDGKTLAGLRSGLTRGKASHFWRWDVETGELLREVDFEVLKTDWMQTRGPRVSSRRRPEGYHRCEAISPDLRHFAGAVFSSHICTSWDSQTGKRFCRIESDPGFTSLLFAPDGKSLVIGVQDGEIHFVAPETGVLLRRIIGPKGQPTPRIFMDQGRILVAGHDNGTTYFWDTNTGKEIRRFQGVQISACSADGRIAASVEDDNSVFIWDLASFHQKVIERRDKLLPHGQVGVAVKPLPLNNRPIDSEPEEAAVRFLIGNARPDSDADPEAATVRDAVAALKAMGADCYYDSKGELYRVSFYGAFHYRSFTDQGMEHVGKLTDLTVLRLVDADITDVGTVHLKNLKQLETLNLQDSDISDAAVENIAGLHNLRTLTLFRTAVTDDALASLRGLVHLEWLSLGETAITDAGLEHLKGHTELHTLYLGRTKITDAGLKHLAGLTKLRYLQLGGNKITDAGLEHLKGHTELHTLYLGQTKITDAGLKHLAGLTKLRYLVLSGNKITSAELGRLKGITQLSTLRLFQTEVDDVGLAEIGKLTSLNSLYLQETKITDAGLKHLAGLTQLTTLSLSDTNVRGPGLEHLKGLPRLEKLYITGTSLSDDGLQYLRFLPKLERVYLDKSNFTDDAIKRLYETRPDLEIRTTD